MIQRFGLPLLVLFVGLAGVVPARAEQFVLTDVSYTHSEDTTEDSHYRVKPPAGAPADWTKPVDYSKGSVHIVVDVKTKPAGDAATKFQICFEGTPAYACTLQSPTYTKTGRVEWDSPFADFWYGGDVDWAKGTKQIALILKDTNNNKPAGDPKYMPTELHVQVTLVSPGAKFAPPPAAGSGGAGGTAGSGGTAGASGSGGMGDTGGRGGAGGSRAGAGGRGGRGGTGGAGEAGSVAGAGGAGAGSSAGASAVSGSGGAGSMATTETAGSTSGAAAVGGGAGASQTASAAGAVSSMTDAQTADADDEESGCRAAGSGTAGAWGWLTMVAWLFWRRRLNV